MVRMRVEWRFRVISVFDRINEGGLIIILGRIVDFDVEYDNVLSIVIGHVGFFPLFYALLHKNA